MKLFNFDTFQFVADLSPHIKSIVWEEQRLSTEGGSFKIVLAGREMREVLDLDLFVFNPNGFKTGIIVSIKEKLNDYKEIEEIEVEGYMLESLLMRRRIIPQLQLKGPVKDIISDILNRNVINTTKSRRNMPVSLDLAANLPTADVEYAFEDGVEVAEALNTICLNNNLFYYFSIDFEAKKLILHVKRDKNKSETVIFSSITDTLYDISKLKTLKNKANCMIVKGDIVAQSVPFSYSYDSSRTGIHRIEGFADHSSIDSENIEASDYLAMLRNRGNEELTKAQIDEAWDFAILNPNYEYISEVFLGDLVSIDISNNRETYKVVSYLYTLSSNNAEEISFTFAKNPTEISNSEQYDDFIDIPEDQLDDLTSDATSLGANKDSKGVEIVGRILCHDCEKCEGTIQKLSEKLYRINIYAYDENNETTIESITKIIPRPLTSRLYFKIPFDILSYVKSDTNTIDIDNFDNSKTRINILTAEKGVLYKDANIEEKPLVFEIPNAYNAKDDIYYAYDIVSENMNFDISFIVSLDPVLDTIPAKNYNTMYPVRLWTNMNEQEMDDAFYPANWTADAGDTITIDASYYKFGQPIKEYDKEFYPIDRKSEAIPFQYTYELREGQKIKDVMLRLPQGFYWKLNIGLNLKKLDYLKDMYDNYYGGAAVCSYMSTGKWAIKKDDSSFEKISSNDRPSFILQDPGLNPYVSEYHWICTKGDPANYNLNSTYNYEYGISIDKRINHLWYAITTRVQRLNQPDLHPNLEYLSAHPDEWKMIYKNWSEQKEAEANAIAGLEDM